MTRSVRVPEPLEPLEHNACRNCAWVVVLLAQVGWVHDTRSGLVIPCLTPEPAYPRCTVCRGKFVARAGVVVPHEMPGTAARCPGSQLLGVDPPPDAAAFTPLWPTSWP